MKSASHNIFHWLFVVGASFVQDVTALGAGLLVLLLAFFVFDSSGSDMVRILIGIPVLIIGTATVVINLYGLTMSLLSHRYSHTRCSFCESPIRMVGSEVKIVCRKCKKEIESSKKS